jgi:hypothetical protein
MANVTITLDDQHHKKLKIFAIEQEVKMPELAAFALDRLAQDLQDSPELGQDLKTWLVRQKGGKETKAGKA